MPDPTPPPARGEMRLYDAMQTPLTAGRHRITTAVDVVFDGGAETIASERFLDVGGPRFSLDPGEIACVVPAANASGAFAAILPQVTLHRRTLPWERSLGAPAGPTPPATPPGAADPPAIPGDAPWLAVLVFSEGELSVLEQVPLEQVVPDDVFTRLGRPAGVTCDAIECSSALLASIMPSREDLALLAHVRRVNAEDRAVAGADPDGWFAVVMANRLPAPGSRTHAVLVSLEQRTDLVPAAPPPFVEGTTGALDPIAVGGRRVASADRPAPPTRARGFDVSVLIPAVRRRLVMLHHWTFDVSIGGSFRDCMQGLDVGLVGDLRDPEGPPVTDTGHLALDLHDRAGSIEPVWYRGPLVAQPLSRDPRGPYHCADQARRVSPETGAEDVSYAAAFEVGRLLAAADARLAQELMRWRRGAYEQAARTPVIAAVRAALALSPALDAELPRALPPTVAVAVLERLAGASAVTADPSGLSALHGVPGLDPAAVAQAWQLASPVAAHAMLRGTALVTAIAATTAPVPPAAPDVAEPAGAGSASSESTTKPTPDSEPADKPGNTKR